jgi:hypothetical protein
MKMLFLGAALVIVALSDGCALLGGNFEPTDTLPESEV